MLVLEPISYKFHEVVRLKSKIGEDAYFKIFSSENKNFYRKLLFLKLERFSQILWILHSYKVKILCTYAGLEVNGAVSFRNLHAGTITKNFTFFLNHNFNRIMFLIIFLFPCCDLPHSKFEIDPATVR